VWPKDTKHKVSVPIKFEVKKKAGLPPSVTIRVFVAYTHEAYRTRPVTRCENHKKKTIDSMYRLAE
jgi:hypothetical protein